MSQNPQSTMGQKCTPGSSDRSSTTPLAGGLTRDERSDRSQPAHVSEAAGHAVDRASEASRVVRSKLADAAGDGKHRIADEIRAFGHAADAAAKSLQEEEHPKVSRYVRGMCQQCEHAADYLDQKEPSELMDDASRFARSNPALFLGAAALTGFAIGRFISATKPKSESGHHESHQQSERAGQRSSARSMYSEGGV